MLSGEIVNTDFINFDLNSTWARILYLPHSSRPRLTITPSMWFTNENLVLLTYRFLCNMCLYNYQWRKCLDTLNIWCLCILRIFSEVLYFTHFITINHTCKNDFYVILISLIFLQDMYKTPIGIIRLYNSFVMLMTRFKDTYVYTSIRWFEVYLPPWYLFKSAWNSN